LGVLEETVFSMFLETKKNRPKIWKKISEGALILVKSLGPAECAVPAER
jgi:hypothetical protein